MAYNKEYYDERKKDVTEQISKLVNRFISDSYSFINSHRELVGKYKKLEQTEKPELSKKEVNSKK